MALVNRAVGALSQLRPSRTRLVVAVGVAALMAGTVAACGNGSSSAGGHSSGGMKDGFTQAPQSSGPLTVWVDSTRMPAAQAYQKTHPKVQLHIVSYDGDANGTNSLQTKVDLYNRTGSGWPDVVWSTQNNEISWAVSAGFTAPLNEGLISNSVLSNFAQGALDPCTVNGKVYCLRNDLAMVVLWYNATLMKQWGYQVPTTWPQYQQLGEEVAKQHPGYIVGNAGDTFTPEIYMWASQCQANGITGLRAVTVNVTSSNCTRMASLLDTLIKAGSMSKLGVFSTAFNKNEKGKVLMLPGPAWFGGAVFDTPSGLNTPKGQVAVAPIPQWPGTSTPSTGNVGGGTWLLSAHSTHLSEAADFLTWVTTNNGYQADLAPGYPAYSPAATAWLANQAKSGYYASDISPVLQQAAGQVWSGWGYGQFSQEAVWAATVDPGLTAGKSIVSMLPAWQSAIAQHAQADGYQVSQ
ncbi:MAG TPA: extracellular solute-binding protein [Streptosporangiaceae bacterium]